MIAMALASLLMTYQDPPSDPHAGLIASEDWEYAAAPRGASSVASVGYAGGLTITVTCYAPLTLSVEFSGVPAQVGERLAVTASREDGRTLEASLTAAQTGELTSGYDSRMARLLRGGGGLSIRAERTAWGAPLRIQADLPARHANLDRVLEACGRRLDEPRDALPMLTDIRSLPNVLIVPPRRPLGRNEVFARAEISCIVTADARLEDCQTEYETPRSGYGALVARSHNGVSIDVGDPATAAGRVLYIIVTGSPSRR